MGPFSRSKDEPVLPVTRDNVSHSNKAGSGVKSSEKNGTASGSSNATRNQPIRTDTSKSNGKKSVNGLRPGLVRTPSVQTRYMSMLLALDHIPRLHNILASFFTWLLLAGYVVFPGTFTTFTESDVVTTTAQNGNEIERKILNEVKNAPLLYIAAACCLIGGGGMAWLWYRWKSNYVWMINRIFLPGLLNSIAGLISTLVNVYTSQNGQYSITAKVTVIVTGACSFVFVILFGIYNNWALSRVKSSHQRELEREERGDEHEGVVHMVKRKAQEPGLEPGSVV